MQLRLMGHVAACAIVIALAGPAVAASYDSYYNARFAYAVRYPTDYLTPQPEPTNGDGRVFLSRDGKSRMLVYGSYFPESFEAGWQMALEREKGERLTYQRKGKQSFVLSGYMDHGKAIFYEAHALVSESPPTQPRRWIVVRFEYPLSERKRFDGIIAQVMADFPRTLKRQ